MHELILEGQARVVLVGVVIPDEIDTGKGDFIASLDPAAIFHSVLHFGEDRDEHALTKEGGLLDEVDNREPTNTFLLISYFKEEPVVVAVRIQIVLDQQVELLLVFEAAIGSAKVAALKIRIYAVFLEQDFLLLGFEFFEELPVVIDQRINTFKFA